jgi:hypothetical protein
LSSENTQGERGSLLFGWRSKQSIYRWRGGKAEQFITSKGENPFQTPFLALFSKANCEVIHQVIQFNNSFF